MFAVTGITGQVGGHVADALMKAGRQVRAVVRDPRKGAGWASRGCTVAVADMADTVALAEAFRGTQGVFILLPPTFDPAPGFREAKAVIAAVRAAITIVQVLALLGFRPRSDHAGQQRGPCPLHGSTHGTACCFSVNTNAHLFHCFKCGRSGNALDLWAAANRLSIYDAAIDLCQRLNIPLPVLAAPAAGNREEETVANESATCIIP